MSEQTLDPTLPNEPDAASPVSAYPDWQKAIRAAQAQAVIELQEHRKQEAAELAAATTKRGQYTADALKLFGIDATPEPGRIGIAIDHILFLVDGKTGNGEIRDERGNLKFDLTVIYRLPDEYEQQRESWGDYSTYYTLQIRQKQADNDLTGYHIELADAIDKVTAAARRFIVQADERRDAEYAKNAKAEVAPPSFSQQLETLIREIVRDECQQQDDYRRGYGGEL